MLFRSLTFVVRLYCGTKGRVDQELMSIFLVIMELSSEQR